MQTTEQEAINNDLMTMVQDTISLLNVFVDNTYNTFLYVAYHNNNTKIVHILL